MAVAAAVRQSTVMTKAKGSPARYTNSCSICLQSLTGKREAELPCGHRFHARCIVSWLQSSQVSHAGVSKEECYCPNCRCDVRGWAIQTGIVTERKEAYGQKLVQALAPDSGSARTAGTGIPYEALQPPPRPVMPAAPLMPAWAACSRKRPLAAATRCTRRLTTATASAKGARSPAASHLAGWLAAA